MYHTLLSSKKSMINNNRGTFNLIDRELALVRVSFVAIFITCGVHCRRETGKTMFYVGYIYNNTTNNVPWTGLKTDDLISLHFAVYCSYFTSSTAIPKPRGILPSACSGTPNPT